MIGQIERINRHLKLYDKSLYSYRNFHGKVLIMRKADRLEASDYGQDDIDLAELRPQYLFALTTDWNVHSPAVEWGIEPLMQKLKSMDVWRDDQWVKNRRRDNERVNADQKRIRRNELKATAADMRRDFAKATNDINTSTLEKVENRRFSDGNC